MKNLSFAFQIDSINILNKFTDSSLLMMNECSKRGYDVFSYQPNAIEIINQQYICKSINHQSNELTYINLNEISCILIRQDPPFDMNYITNTLLLEPFAHKTFNNVTAIRNFPEKLSALNFPKFIPETIIASSPTKDLKLFLKTHKKLVAKNPHSCGGKDVWLVSSEEELENSFQDNEHIIFQQFLTDAYTGDKRVLFLEGKVMGQYLRTPAEGDFRCNTAAGGSTAQTTLTKKELEICEEVGEFLVSKNIWFAGVDLLGEKLIEINVTSPTGLAALNKLYNQKSEKLLIDSIESII